MTRDKFWRKHVHNIAREKVIFGGQSQGLEISRHAPRIDKERKFQVGLPYSNSSLGWATEMMMHQECDLALH